MRKPLVGHHLMRVRIRKKIFEKLKDAADEESVRTGEHVTVSDLVRASCYNYLLIQEAVRRLETTPLLELEEGILVLHSPLLGD